MENIKFRKFENADLNELMAVWENAQILAHPFLPEVFLEKERYNIPNIYIPLADTLVAENSGHVIGFISMINNEIGGLFVEPDFHGIGVGTALVDMVRELHTNLTVEVFEKNTIGRSFYAKYGFKLIGKNFHTESCQNMFRLEYTIND
ncbi:MAG: GNAT family N-acetyltransferase [Clostridiales bacterium]|nr:GNAT family N-acetyltransferase [Clostridiales bacterium]